MANKYWVGGTGTWDGTTTTNWSTSSGGSGGAAVPTTADVAIFDTLSNATSYTVTRTATTAVLGINMSNPLTGNLTFAGSSAIQTTTSGLTIASGVIWTNTGAYTFGETQTVTTNGVILTNNITLNSASTGATISLGSAFTTSGTFTLSTSAASLTFNNYNFTCFSFAKSSPGASNIAFGTGILTLTGSGIVFNISAGTATFTGTPTVYITNNTATATSITTGNSVRYNFYLFNGGYTFSFGGAGPTVGSLNFSSFTGTLSSVTTVTIYGSLTMSSGMTYTIPSGAFTFAATTTGNTITCATKTLPNCTFSGAGGGWILQDNFASGALTLSNTGTIDFNAKTVTCTTAAVSGGTFGVNSGSLVCSSTLTQTGGTITATTGNVQFTTFTSTTGTRAINMGSGTWTVTGLTWSTASTSLTIDAGTSTIVLSNNTTTAKTFAGGGVTYGTLQIGATGGSTAIATYTITGANTFNSITSTKSVASTITLPASTTTTVGNWTVAGSSGNLITLNSSTAGTQATLTLTGGGIVSVNYLNIRDSAATPSTLTWYAGANSVNTSNNTGWIFAAPARAANFNFFMFFNGS